MNIENSFPKITKLVTVLIIIILSTYVINYFLTDYTASIIDSSMESMDRNILDNAMQNITNIRLFTNYLPKIVLAFWIYNECKKENESKLTWVLFTLFFGIISVILFYTFRILKELKKLNTQISENISKT